MTSTLLNNIANQFSLSADELIQKGVKSFLFNQLQNLEIERRKTFNRFSIQSFDQLISENPDQESELKEDFQRVDFLTHRIDEISNQLQSY